MQLENVLQANMIRFSFKAKLITMHVFSINTHFCNHLSVSVLIQV